MKKALENKLLETFKRSQQIAKVSDIQVFCKYQTSSQILYFKRILTLKLGDNSETSSSKKIQSLYEQISDIINLQYKLSRSNISSYILPYNDIVFSSQYAYLTHRPFLFNLEQKMKQKTSYFQKISILSSLALAIQDIHKQKYCVTVLKPTTILITNQNQGKFDLALADSRSLKKLNPNNMIKNQYQLESILSAFQKKTYVAPEVTKGDYYTLSADIWSFGVICYEYLFSRKFVDSQKILQNLHFPQDCPPWIRNTMPKMICLSPKDRYKIADIVMILKNAKLSSESTLKFYNCQYSDNH